MAEPIDTDAIRRDVDRGVAWVALRSVRDLCDEVDRLRAENAQAWAIDRVVKGTNERLADEVDRLRADAMAKAHRVGELAREVDRLRAEVDALADLIEWVRDAPHRDSCDKWGGSGRTSCTCGRDALDALDACRGE